MSALSAQAIPFIHPELAAAALAVGLIPILIHWINRRRFVRMPWAAMAFLLSANRRSVRRLRLEQILLLLIRIGLMVGFGMAVARPYVSASTLFPASSSRTHRVILLDNSLSMNAQTREGETRFATAKLFAQRLVDSFPPTDAVSLVTLAAPATAVLDLPVYDRRFVRDQLRGVEVTERSTDVIGALRTAGEVLSESPGPQVNRAVYLISDLPRSTWQESAGADGDAVTAWRQLAKLTPRPTESLYVLPVAADAPPNLAVVRLAAESTLVGTGVPVRIVAEVANFGPTTARGVVLQVRRDGQIVRRQPLPRIEPGAPATTVATIVFDGVGTHIVEAKLAGQAADALREDDTRYLSLEVRETVRVLVVDGRPGTTQLAGQAGFLVAALAPGGQAVTQAVLLPTIIGDAELTPGAMLNAEIVVLCNVQRLAPETWRSLETFVAEGGGLFVLAGDLMNPDHYNRHGFRDGKGVLPVKFRSVETATDLAAPIGFKPERLAHAIVNDFAGRPESGLFTARVERYLPVEPFPGRGEVVLHYTNDDPALIASPFGAGRVLIFTTSPNMDWTNLPARGDYVSLMVNSVAYLLPRRGDHRNLRVGELIRERLSAAQTSLPLRVHTGATASTEPSLIPDDGNLALHYGPIEQAGVATVSIGSESRAFAVNIDSQESDLAPVDFTALVGDLKDVAQVVTDMEGLWEQSAVARASELASLLMFLVLLLLFLEMWMAMRFGSRGTGPATPASAGFGPIRGER